MSQQAGLECHSQDAWGAPGQRDLWVEDTCVRVPVAGPGQVKVRVAGVMVASSGPQLPLPRGLGDDGSWVLFYLMMLKFDLTPLEAKRLSIMQILDAKRTPRPQKH